MYFQDVKSPPQKNQNTCSFQVYMEHSLGYIITHKVTKQA